MILVCGEALIDLFIQAKASGGLSAQAVVGGSPFNVAIGLGRLGRPVAFLAKVSTDALGEELMATLANNGVDTRYIGRSPRGTTLSIASASPSGLVEYRFYEAGAVERDLTPADLPTADDPNIKAIAAGSYSLAVEPVGSSIEQLVAREGQRKVVSLDPNLRLDLTPDLAEWRARFDRLSRNASIIKASEEDIALAYGAGTSLAEIAERWREAGVALVVITRGAKGAVGFTAGAAVEVPGRPVAVVDTVGAGDTFHAALLAHLDERGWLERARLSSIDRESVAAALDFAAEAAAITCTRRGADLPTAADVARVRGSA